MWTISKNRDGTRALQVAAIAAGLWSGAAVAQSRVALEEITVTARKQEVDIQDAPVAVSVVTGEDFQRSNIVRLDNFNGFAPGLTIAKNDGAGRVVAIRGVGWETAQNLSTQPSVLVYIDGIYVANPLSIGTDLGDIEHIEVYRGPQGTEFGQGTTGGSINIVMQKPEFEKLTGDAELSYGSYEHIRARVGVNVPLTDTLAVRASVQRYDREGYADIVGGALDGYDLDDADSITGKAALRWAPSEDLSIYLSGFWQDSDQHAAAQKNVDDPNPDERELTQDYPGIFELENNVYSAIIEWQTPWNVTVKSLTGLQNLRKAQTVDGDRLNEALTSVAILHPFFPPNNWDVLPFWDNDSDSVSQELNLTFKGERLDWVVGGYYLHHENFNYFLEAGGPAPFSDSEDELADPGPDTLPPFASVLNFVEARTLTRDDWAVYGQATYRLNDTFAVTGGVRWQDEEQLDESLQFWFNRAEQTLKDDKVTWKAGLDVRLTEDNLVYFLVSTGWKNGGTNPGALPNFNNPDGAEDVPAEFQPEEVTSFEVGSKNVFYNGRVRFNVIGFFYDYENLQFMQEDPDPFAGGTGNIPDTDIYGVETEFSWFISDSWRLDGMFTWMDGEFKDDFMTLDVVDFLESGQTQFIPDFAQPCGFFCANTVGRAALRTNLEGNEPPKLVDITARLGLTNTHNFANGSVLTSRVDYIHRGEYQYRVFNNPLVDTVPDYDIVNLYFQYDLPNDSPFSVALTVTNVFDEDGVNARFSNPFGLLTTSEEYIPPREVIGTIRYTWD
jgi:iron complex outermembrane receptor protein